MKVFKIFISICAVLVTLVLLVALVSPSQYTVKKEIVIQKNKENVFAYIKLLKNQENYSSRANMDPDLERTYHGIDGQVGFTSTWQSKKTHVGKGEKTILKLVENQRIEAEMTFFEPFETTSLTYMTTESISPSETRLTSGLKGKMPLPFNLLLWAMDMEEELGPPLALELETIKKLLEK